MQAPPKPKSRNGYSIPENFKFLASGEPFLLYDSGICDIDRILVFGTEAGLNALEKYCEWAADARSVYVQRFITNCIQCTLL